MNRVKVFLVFVIVLLTVVSCSIDKRLYSKGYHIEWNKNLISKKSIVSNSNYNETLPIKTESEESETIGLNSNETIISKAIQTNLDTVAEINTSEIIDNLDSNVLKPITNECDSIVLRSGNVILGKVIEISDITIKFTKCNSTKDVVRELNQNEVLYINYSDGTKDEFSRESRVNEEVIGSTVIAGVAILIASLESGIGLLAGFLAFLLSLIAMYETKSSIVSYLSMLAAIASIVIIVMLFII